MFLFTYSAAVLTIFFVVTAVFLFLRGHKDDLTYIFICYVLSSAVWIGGNAAADISNTESTLILMSGIALFGSTFIVTFFLMFVDTFIDGKLPSVSRTILYFLPSILLTIFSFSEHAILDTIFPPHQPAQIIPGIHYYFFLLFLFAGLCYALTRLISYYRKETGARRLQTQYIIIGFVALFIGGVTFDIVLPLMGELRFFNLGPQFSFIFVISSGYAVFKHHLLDIRIVIQRGIIYTILFIGIVITYLLLLNTAGTLFQKINHVAGILSAGLTTIIGIFSVPYIDNYLRKKTDRFFFKNRYNYAEALYGLSEKINRNVNVEDIKQLTEDSLQDILKTKTVVIHITKKEPMTTETFSNAHANDVTLTVPITLDEMIIGTIFLGEKKSGDTYTEEDTVLIRTFSHQIAVAFEKARLYKEVLDYSSLLEGKVTERTKQIAKLQNDQTQMMLDISHKLQNPLTIIKSEVALLQQQMPQTTELVFFEKTIDDASAFIYDLLHLARFDVVAESIEKESQNLSEHVHELVEYFDIVAKHNGIELQSFVTPNILFSYNKEKMTELITNIVSNSVKYIGTKENKKITITLVCLDNSIVLTIEDTGIGIDKNDIPHIFERFYRTNSNTSATIDGTGLGLAICKKIVELHNGTIKVKSTIGVGSTFSIVLPL